MCKLYGANTGGYRPLSTAMIIFSNKIVSQWRTMMSKLRNRVLALREKGLKPKDIAEHLKCSAAYVYNIKPAKEKQTATEPSSSAPKNDTVNHPTHYVVGGIETIDYIEAKQLNYNLGNAVKYISRSPYKGKKVEDLKKAVWYLEREIANLSK